MQEWTQTKPYLDLHCELGEAPYYEQSSNTLRFVDIKARRLHTIDLSKGPNSLSTLQFDIPVGYTADIEGVDSSTKIIIGGKKGVYSLDRRTGDLELLKSFHDNLQDKEHAERLRSNDGAIDPQGRLWFGTQTDFDFEPPKPEGMLVS